MRATDPKSLGRLSIVLGVVAFALVIIDTARVASVPTSLVSLVLALWIVPTVTWTNYKVAVTYCLDHIVDGAALQRLSDQAQAPEPAGQNRR